MELPEVERVQLIFQEWFFPSGDEEGFKARMGF
jgi:hypothetical protein